MVGRSRVLSKYRLLARLGSGGMAEVYLAIAEGPAGFNKLQVLKVLRPDLSGQERVDFLQMFQDEGRLAARLNHPNIVQSHEIGSVDGLDFIAMEYLDGQPLSRVEERAWSEPGSGFPLEMQLFVLCQVLEGLEYAHGLSDWDGTLLNIVHRDVSPQNVFITYAGQTKLVDFGIAKTLESCKTRAGVVKGKVPYMAPEQVLGSNIDHRADLFSVGVMVWEAIARRSMHGSLSVYEILRRLVQGELPKIRDVAPDVPPALERIVQRALALAPHDRYPDASAFREDLVAFLDGYRKVSARSVGERVAQMFAAERRQISEVIRQEMAEVSDEEGSADELGPIHVVPTLRLLGESAAPVSTAGPLTGPTTKPTPAPTASPHQSTARPLSVAMTKPNESDERKRWIGGIAAIGLVALVVAIASSSSRGNERGVSARPSPSGKAGTALPSTSVGMNIRTIPSEAILMLDGLQLGKTPYAAAHARDDRQHLLELRAPGFNPNTMTIRLDRDLDLEVQLFEAARAPGPAPEKPRSAAIVRAPIPAPAPPKLDVGRDLPPPPKPKAKSPTLDTSDPW